LRTREDVGAEKLRGGFYSPDTLVTFCLDRVAELLPGSARLRILEPSAGDGAFVRGLASRDLAARVEEFVAVELLPSEAERCRREIRLAPFTGRVFASSFIPWATSCRQNFDVAIGNPPFVRFQFVDEESKLESARLAARLGVLFRGVSNLWIPVLLGAIGGLREGGAFSFIVPAESFTGISAAVARRWLLANTDALQFDLFPPGSFPSVLQQVVVMSGLRRGEPRPGAATLQVREHDSYGGAYSWSHAVDPDLETWTRFLLAPAHLDALADARRLPSVRRLSDVAKFEVAAVTGANDFFSVDEETLAKYGLETWATPLLPRARHAKGLVYGKRDHRRTRSAAKAWLLDFAEDRSEPEDGTGAAAYLAAGKRLGLDERYKTRIRDPWYRVPHIRPGRLMLSKRSHRYPRVILNEAGVVTTDTIYRGWMRPGFKSRDRGFVAGFHNSLTLLTAELEGRSFGGGVLELVPSEVSRLLVSMPEGFGAELGRLHEVARGVSDNDGEILVEETDLLLRKYEPGLTDDVLDRLREARLLLLQRRLDRN